MFCPECGTQIPDGAKFCSNCGKAFSEQPEHVQPDVGFQQTASPDNQTDFGKAEPSFEPPSAYVRVVPLKKSNKRPLIIAVCCAAAAAVVLIVLFAVILPNQGLAGRLRHKWLCTDDGAVETYYDFKKKEVTGGGITLPFDWKAVGQDRVSVTVNLFGISATEEFYVSFSGDERTMILSTRSTGRESTYVRVD